MVGRRLPGRARTVRGALLPSATPHSGRMGSDRQCGSLDHRVEATHDEPDRQEQLVQDDRQEQHGGGLEPPRYHSATPSPCGLMTGKSMAAMPMIAAMLTKSNRAP